MPEEISVRPYIKDRIVVANGTRKIDRLALLFEGIFAAICRVHSRRQIVQEPDSFRARMKQALAEIAATAARRGYRQDDVHETTFAVVAFLDEAMLSASGANEKWIGKTLGQELYRERSAGETFFKRLDALRAMPDSEDLAEVLEVYYLCLLLGYEGKYGGGSKGELLQIMVNVRERIERILGNSPDLSPDKMLPDEPPPPLMVTDPIHRQLHIFALAAFLFALLCYGACFLQLQGMASNLHHSVVQRLATGGVL
jgi:type VI secretion system protein ImpK